MDKLKTKRIYSHKKRQQLKELNHTHGELKRKCMDEDALSVFSHQFEDTEHEIKVIKIYLQESEQEQEKAMKGISDAEIQLQKTKYLMEECKELILKKINELESDRDKKLDHYNSMFSYMQQHVLSWVEAGPLNIRMALLISGKKKK